MILAEIGYDQITHEAGIAKIKAMKLRIIDQIIRELCKLYFALYGTDEYGINRGLCQEFANDVQDLMEWDTGNEADALWEDEVGIKGEHCIIKHRDRYYDSQHPEGSTYDELRQWEIWE